MTSLRSAGDVLQGHKLFWYIFQNLFFFFLAAPNKLSLFTSYWNDFRSGNFAKCVFKLRLFLLKKKKVIVAIEMKQK